MASRSVEEPLLHAIGPLSVARAFTFTMHLRRPRKFLFHGCTPVVIDPPLSSFVNQARRRFYTWTRKRDTASAATCRRSLDGWGTHWSLVTCDLFVENCKVRNACACLFNLFKWSCKKGVMWSNFWMICEIEDWEMWNFQWIERLKIVNIVQVLITFFFFFIRMYDFRKMRIFHSRMYIFKSFYFSLTFYFVNIFFFPPILTSFSILNFHSTQWSSSDILTRWIRHTVS